LAYVVSGKDRVIPEDGKVRFLWEIKNVGRTPAVVTEAAARFVFNTDAVPLPDVPDYGWGEPQDERILVPGGTLTFCADWYEWKEGRYQQLYQIADVRPVDVIVGFGYVKYRDTISGTDERISRFCDGAIIGGRKINGKFTAWGSAPAEYTKCT
jgi:hypothetical protein